MIFVRIVHFHDVSDATCVYSLGSTPSPLSSNTSVKLEGISHVHVHVASEITHQLTGSPHFNVHVHVHVYHIKHSGCVKLFHTSIYPHS